MFTKQTFKSHDLDIASIVFYLFLCIFFTYLLFKGLIEKASAIESLSNIIWISACMFQILKSRKKILHIPSPDDLDRNVEENKIDIKSTEITALKL